MAGTEHQKAVDSEASLCEEASSMAVVVDRHKYEGDGSCKTEGDAPVIKMYDGMPSWQATSQNEMRAASM